MTKLLDSAVRAVQKLAPDAQDEIARLLLQLAGDDEPQAVQLSSEEEASFAEAERGEFASDEKIRAIWAKHGL